ncbi:unnamed protein product [Lactuca virosa]|uniref:ABC transporter domain-containing protein n=1 Tax=Lactuca virosa TaxID=75947 RepID=A0AAU9NRB5_9ASTR|nr:unnamed protein product [Lactuca virosa]
MCSFRAEVTLPTVEVRYEHLNIEADCFIGDRALPTLGNAVRNIAESALTFLGIRFSKSTKLTLLSDASGIIKPSRMTLLLGPPSSGKTTLLQALAGKLDSSLKVEGKVTYNGHTLKEFVPQRTCAYVSQHDVHVAEMTVKETLDFSARCQGTGSYNELLAELERREKVDGILPEPEVDLFMKAIAMEGTDNNLITHYILKILGLDICRDTIVGNEMIRGISGGQKKRVTTGEMIVGPTKTLFMDDISTGLDSSTTFQIVKCLQKIAHLTKATIFISLLQPPPETFNLFDDIILLSQGHIVYHGPREHVLEFFESCGFRCPERKGHADFLQELQNDLSLAYNKATSQKSALVFKKYLVPKKELLKASFQKEFLIMKKNSPIYIFKIIQTTIVAIIGATVFLKTNMHTNNEEDGGIYVGALLFSLITNTFNGFGELPMIIERLPVIYKQRDLLFHPPWAFTIPTFLLGVPISIIDSTVWTVVTYNVIGFAPEASRFLKQWLLTFMIQQMAGGLFRLVASICRTMTIANTGGVLVVELAFLVGGFIIPKGQIPKWWGWAYWVSPFSYGFNAFTINEMFSPRWMNKMASDNVTELGVAVLRTFDVTPDKNMFWIGVAVLLGFAVVFNFLFTLSLTYLNPLGKAQAVISKETLNEMETILEERDAKENSSIAATNPIDSTRGMVLPFTPLTMSFININYYVDMPPEMEEQGMKEDKLQLLQKITGAFRPGVLTALMGVSGAGKTTLMDVLAGRKTGGLIQGDIRISGFPKKQETFARVSGYCEQTDIHSPQVTVYESLVFSAFQRLPKEASKEVKLEIPGVPKLKSQYNPATWMLEVTSDSTESRLGTDFSEHYRSSPLYKENNFLVEQLSKRTSGVKDLTFKTQYSQSTWGQFKCCIKKQWSSYWRTPDYNLVRFFFALVTALLLGTIFWKVGTKRDSSTDLTTIIGAMYVAVMFAGFNNCVTIIPVASLERTVFYREQAAGMYSALPYAMAQVIVEIPFVLVQTMYYTVIVYSMVSFEWTVVKFLWFFFISFFTFLYFTYYGLMIVSITPNHQAASIFAAAINVLFNLFSGFFIPRPVMFVILEFV